jgi:protein involved in polysaccharide export with SLBB domain
VARGETLWAIADQVYGAPWRWPEIHEANRATIADPNRIWPGQELAIPRAGVRAATSTDGDGREVHEVVRGETLWGIADGVYAAAWRWPEIYEANRDQVADPDLIRPGQRLVLPRGATALAAAAPATPGAEPSPAAAPLPARAADPQVAPSPEPFPVEPAPAASPEAATAPEPAPAPDAAPAPAPSPPPPAAEPAAPAAPDPTTREPSTPPRAHGPAAVAYSVRPGDIIETRFHTAAGKAVETVQGSRTVDRRGNVFYPFIGALQVAGLDATTIRTLLVERFGELYNEPVVTLNVKLSVNVTGMVRAPGRYTLDPTATVLDALSGAGGVGPDVAAEGQIAADASAVQLIRDGETTLLDLRPGVSGEAVGVTIQSGDWIHVPPMRRSALRDDIQFWGSVMSLVTSVAAAVLVIAR